MVTRKANAAPPSETRKALTTCVIAQTLGAPMPQVLINGGVLSLFILALGGSKFAVGSAFTVNFLAQLVRVFVSPAIDVANRKRLVVLWFTVSTLLFGLLFLAHPVSMRFGNQAAVWFVVAVFLLQRVTINIGATAWFSMLGVIVPDSLRGRFFGRMRATFQIASFVLIVVIGWYLGESPDIAKFYAVFALLLVLALFRPLLLLALPSPPPDRDGKPEPVVRNFIRPMRDKPWRDFIVFWACLAFTANIARPFAVPFLKEDLAFPSSIATYASAGLLLGMVVSLMPWGRLADRRGNRLVLLINILLMALSFDVLALTPYYDACPWAAMVVSMAAFVTTGVALGGLGIGHTVRQLHAAPAEYRSSYMAVFFTANGVVAGIATLLAGSLLDQLPTALHLGGLTLPPVRLFFVLSSLLVAATTFLVWRLEPVAEKPIYCTVVDFLSLLPPSLTIPLRLINMDPHNQPGGDEGRD